MTTNIVDSPKHVEVVEGRTDLAEVVASASDWLVSSGVQMQDGSPRGGFAAWYEADSQSYPYVYSEITGYGLTMLTSLWRRTGDARFLNSAICAGDWFISSAHESGGLRCLFPLKATRFDYKVNQIYAFDCGVILSGMVNLYRATGERKYLDASRRIGDWLVHGAQKQFGFFPLYDTDKHAFVESDAEWSLCSGSYHTKVAIGLLNLYDVTKEDEYLAAVKNVCDFALTFQQSDGRFISFPSDGGTNSHPHTYSAEGLWVAGKYLRREDYLQASAAGACWLFQWQSPDGLVPRHYHNGKPSYNERVDILAQAIRLAMIHVSERRIDEAQIMPGVEKLLPIVLRNQAISHDRRVNGGFFFGRLSDGTPMPHVNTWVTMFAVQALQSYDDFLRGSLNIAPFDMV